MTMRTMLALVAAVAVALLAACSTTQYIIGTKSGQLLISYGEPRLDKETNTYKIWDAEGKERTISAADVSQIMER
jgi:outer membrane biogenesis lipoprotein LolB